MSQAGSFGSEGTTSPLTTKGDVYTYDTDDARLPVGADGLVLTADSGQATGLIWAAGGSTSPLTTKGDLFGFSTVDDRLAVGADGLFLKADSGQATGLIWSAASTTLPDAIYGGSAASHSVNTTTAFAPVNYRDFGSIEILVRSFDTTTTEYMQGFFQVPSDLGAGASSVTFDIIGSSSTAAASKNVKFTFDFVEVADSGLMTGAYGGAIAWDDQAVSATQDDQDIISNTETITDLGWTAGNMIYYRLYRSTATTNNLATDYDVISFNIRVPRA